jgi:hypothetical protein
VGIEEEEVNEEREKLRKKIKEGKGGCGEAEEETRREETERAKNNNMS